MSVLEKKYLYVYLCVCIHVAHISVHLFIIQSLQPPCLYILAYLDITRFHTRYQQIPNQVYEYFPSFKRHRLTV